MIFESNNSVPTEGCYDIDVAILVHIPYRQPVHTKCLIVKEPDKVAETTLAEVTKDSKRCCSVQRIEFEIYGDYVVFSVVVYVHYNTVL